MERKITKPIALNLRISERTKEKLTELQQILSQKTGTQLTLTQTVEASIDQTLSRLKSMYDQEKLFKL